MAAAEPNDQRPPEPPVDLAARSLPWRTAPAGTCLARIHRAVLAPLWFGPSAGGTPHGRFDDPMRIEERPEATFGVCYLGWGREAAFAESFLRRPGVQIVPLATFDARALTDVASTRVLRLVALFGPGLAALGATAAVSHGPHDVARRWARALWAHPDRPDGLAYRCRHDDDTLAVALFDRAADALVVRGTGPVRADRVWFGQMLDRYGLVLAD